MTKRKYTKQEREDAALICQIAASNGSSTWCGQLVLGLEQDPATGGLARAALGSVRQRFHGNDAYAEAEALIRTGWSPS